jgi:hypothetical protein
MAIEYKMEQFGNHIRVVGTGNITVGELMGLCNLIGLFITVTKAPCSHPEFSVLIDLRDAAYAPHNNDEVNHITMAAESRLSVFRNRHAIVVNGATFLAAENLSVCVRSKANVEIKVFVDINAAESFCMGTKDKKLT